MKLISCDGCAVVLDADKLPFPTDIWEDDESIDTRKARYNQNTGTYSAFVPCPVCDADIIKDCK